MLQWTVTQLFYRYVTLTKSYVLMKMIVLKIKMKIEQEEQSYSNVSTRKYIKEQIVDSLIKSQVDVFFIEMRLIKSQQ